MTIERTQEYRRIKRLAPHWELLVSDKVFYLVVGADEGVIVFHSCFDSPGMLMHVYLGQTCRGARAAQAYREAFEWMFDNTDETILRGRIPAYNYRAHVMAVHCGGVFEEIDMDGLRCYSVQKSDFERKAAA